MDISELYILSTQMTSAMEDMGRQLKEEEEEEAACQVSNCLYKFLSKNWKFKAQLLKND